MKMILIIIRSFYKLGYFFFNVLKFFFFFIFKKKINIYLYMLTQFNYTFRSSKLLLHSFVQKV